MAVTTPEIHPTAVVDPKAQLAEGVTVGPYSIIGGDVVIGEGTVIGAHCVITGHTVMGKKNRVFAGAVLGSEPQDVKFHGEETYLEIGD
jgi:UDP-N-acetylglucosamine acyltransferase